MVSMTDEDKKISSASPDDEAELIARAREDDRAFEELVNRYHRFIMTSAYQAVHHFVTESDDEWSTALIAFHEAVRTYDVSKGSFPSFAALVIRRRITDEMRRADKYKNEYAAEPRALAGEAGDNMDETPSSKLELEIQQKERELSENSAEIPGANPLKDEIEAISGVFKAYGFTFFDLADVSPKAEKTKKNCAAAVGVLLRNGDIFRQMQKTKMLPIAEILRISRLPRKLLERHRKYIIAAAEILNGEYPMLAEYMSSIRKEIDS